MAILFAGTSHADVDQIGTVNVSTTAAALDTYVAEGLFCGVGGGNAFEIKFEPQSDFWVSFYENWASSAGGAREGVGFWGWETGVELFRVSGNGNAATVGLGYHNGASMQLAQVLGSGFSGLHRFDIHLKMADTGGIFEVYKDGVLDAQLSGITTDTILTAATKISRMTVNAMALGNSTYSAIIIADEDTRGMRLEQKLPSGAGATTGWTGAYTTVDETGIGDTDYAWSDTLNALSTFAYPASHADFSAGYNVRAVIAGMRAAAPGDGSKKLAGVVRTSGTDYATAALAARTQYGRAQAIWDVNPDTLAAWTVSAASGSQIGMKVIS